MKNRTFGEIRAEITDFITRHDQHELRYVIAYCVGYFGAVDATVWDVIRELMSEGVIV